jgi:hypothetical protein
MHRILLVCFVCLLFALLTEGVAACRQPLAAAQGAQFAHHAGAGRALSDYPSGVPAALAARNENPSGLTLA